MTEDTKYYSLDRLEGGLAVLLGGDETPLVISVEALEDPPAPCGDAPAKQGPSFREGDVLVHKNGRWQRDDAETARRRKKNAALLANLRRRGGQGRL